MFRTTLALGTFALIAVGAPAQHDLHTLAFMSGCWRSDPDVRGGVIEERYSPPAANLMVGTTRYLRRDSVTGFEFSRIDRRSDGTIALTPYPSGVSSVSFTASKLAANDVAFENRSHDFPTRILYRREAGDVLIARIEGNDGKGTEWRMKRVDCDAGAEAAAQTRLPLRLRPLGGTAWRTKRGAARSRSPLSRYPATAAYSAR